MIINWVTNYLPECRSWWTHVVHDGATIGIASSLIGFLLLELTMIGMNSTITKDVPPFTMVFGSPAKAQNGILSNEKFGMQNSSGEIYDRYCSILEDSRREILDLSSIIGSKKKETR